MNVLFLVSGNVEPFDIAPFVKSQGDSLVRNGIQLSYFQVSGRGVRNYWKSIYRLRRYIRTHKVDLIHAHYSLCGWVAVLGSRGKPVVLSLMGSDAMGDYVGHKKIKLTSRFPVLLTWLVQPFVKAIISKSREIEKIVYRRKRSFVIPNGVDLERFITAPHRFRSGLELKTGIQYVLFLGNPGDVNKNFALAQEAVSLLKRNDVELINVFNKPQEVVIQYLNSVDVFVSCSFAEGSANVIKEAMACNCPMVVTEAGDANWLIAGEPGCYIASYNPLEFSKKLTLALDYAVMHGRTNARRRLSDLGLDSDSVTERIMQVYGTVLGTNKK
jgi:glycosyltransferase involved in cell wall biosynthesis